MCPQCPKQAVAYSSYSLTSCLKIKMESVSFHSILLETRETPSDGRVGPHLCSFVSADPTVTGWIYAGKNHTLLNIYWQSRLKYHHWSNSLFLTFNTMHSQMNLLWMPQQAKSVHYCVPYCCPSKSLSAAHSSPFLLNSICDKVCYLPIKKPPNTTRWSGTMWWFKEELSLMGSCIWKPGPQLVALFGKV